MIKEIINNQLKQRFQQVHTFGQVLSVNNSLLEDIEKHVKGNKEVPYEDIEGKLIEYKKISIQSNLLEQTVNSTILRIIEVYTIAKLGEIEVELDEKDQKFIELTLSNKQIDLFGAENNKLVILNAEFHKAAIDDIKIANETEGKGILSYIVNK